MSSTTAGSLKVTELAALDHHHDQPIDGNTAFDQWFFNNLLDVCRFTRQGHTAFGTELIKRRHKDRPRRQ